VIYAGVLAAAIAAIGLALALRTDLGVSVERDRAPIFVRLADGGIRNGYTLKLVNKRHEPVQFVLVAADLPGAALSDPETTPQPVPSLPLSAKPDAVSAVRVFVRAPAGAASRPLTFRLRDAATGDSLETTTVFLGPAP
jgi:polyferredoxin